MVWTCLLFCHLYILFFFINLSIFSASFHGNIHKTIELVYRNQWKRKRNVLKERVGEKGTLEFDWVGQLGQKKFSQFVNFTFFFLSFTFFDVLHKRIEMKRERKKKQRWVLVLAVPAFSVRYAVGYKKNGNMPVQKIRLKKN